MLFFVMGEFSNGLPKFFSLLCSHFLSAHHYLHVYHLLVTEKLGNPILLYFYSPWRDGRIGEVYGVSSQGQILTTSQSRF